MCRPRNANLVATLSVATLLLVGIESPRAGTIVDNFGQTVDEEVDRQVTLAREMRMEQMPNFDIDGAIEILQQIVDSHPTYYRAWFNLGLSYYARDPKDIDTAVGALTSAASIQESDPAIVDGSLYNTLGFILLNGLRYAESEKYLTAGLSTQATNSDWTNSALLYNLGRLNFETRQYDKAVAFLDEAIMQFQNPAAIELKAIVESTKE